MTQSLECEIVCDLEGLSGGAGYFIEPRSEAHATTVATKAHSPKSELDVRFQPSVQRTADGDELQLNVTLENRGLDQRDTALALTVFDDTGEVWLPESIKTPGQVPAKGAAVQEFVVPSGLPDGYFRLEVNAGSRSTPGEHPETRVHNVYFVVAAGSLSILTPGDWLVKSQAMIGQNVPNPNPPNADPETADVGSGDTKQTEDK